MLSKLRRELQGSVGKRVVAGATSAAILGSLTFALNFGWRAFLASLGGPPMSVPQIGVPLYVTMVLTGCVAGGAVAGAFWPIRIGWPGALVLGYLSVAAGFAASTIVLAIAHYRTPPLGFLAMMGLITLLGGTGLAAMVKRIE